MNFVVIGGTGLIGSKVVARLTAKGHAVIVAAPSTGVDTLTGAGLDHALRGADVVIDLANSPSFADDDVLHFFRTAGRTIAEAEARAGVRHHVALGVVGTDRLAASGYFRGKIAQEAVIRAAATPYTIVHSTQFYEFLPGIVQSAADGQTVRLAPALVQPIASDDVADAVTRVALAAPVNGIVEIAGPERASLADLAQRFMGIVQDPREVVADVHAPYFGAELENDTLLPRDDAWLGSTGFQAWLLTSQFARFAQPVGV